MDKKVWIASIIAFILGFFVAWLIFRGGVPVTPAGTSSLADEEATEEATSGEVAPVVSTQTGISGEGTISVSDQAFGDAVSISSVTLGSAGWIAIHEDRDGGLGNILGAGWFPEGSSENVQVELLRGTIPGALYHAVLRSDDGDREFDHKKDLPFEDTEGKTLETTFRTLSLEE